MVVYRPFGDWVVNGLMAVGGQTAVMIVNAWTPIAANPTYQQIHILIWFAVGMVFMFALMKLAAKRKIPVVSKALTPQRTSQYEYPEDVITAENPTPTRQTSPVSQPEQKKVVTNEQTS